MAYGSMSNGLVGITMCLHVCARVYSCVCVCVWQHGVRVYVQRAGAHYHVSSCVCVRGSMAYGSMSNGLVGITLALANGTVLEMTPESHPHLFKAARVSNGRLGVVLDVTLEVRNILLMCEEELHLARLFWSPADGALLVVYSRRPISYSVSI
eukprot:6232685-Pyramimonas_sp.AAC.1